MNCYATEVFVCNTYSYKVLTTNVMVLLNPLALLIPTSFPVFSDLTSHEFYMNEY